jgi:hypothetical protein
MEYLYTYMMNRLKLIQNIHVHVMVFLWGHKKVKKFQTLNSHSHACRVSNLGIFDNIIKKYEIFNFFS